MGKATQPKDNVPKYRTAALSGNEFTGNPAKATTADLESACLSGLEMFHALNGQSKETNKARRELREKLTPWLRTFRARLNNQGGKKGTGWQNWFEAHKTEIGISRKTADRWIDGDQDKKKYANLDNADGLTIGGKKYSYKLIVKDDRVERIDVEPETAAEPVPETTKSVAAKKLDATKTKLVLAKFLTAYKREQKDDGRSKWAESFLAALTAEYEKHPEWLKRTVDSRFKEARTTICARANAEEAQAGWTKVGRKHWKHEDGRSIEMCGQEYVTFDKDDFTIKPTSNNLIDAMRAKRQGAGGDAGDRWSDHPREPEATWMCAGHYDEHVEQISRTGAEQIDLEGL